MYGGLGGGLRYLVLGALRRLGCAKEKDAKSYRQYDKEGEEEFEEGFGKKAVHIFSLSPLQRTVLCKYTT